MSHGSLRGESVSTIFRPNTAPQLSVELDFIVVVIFRIDFARDKLGLVAIMHKRGSNKRLHRRRVHKRRVTGAAKGDVLKARQGRDETRITSDKTINYLHVTNIRAARELDSLACSDRVLLDWLIDDERIDGVQRRDLCDRENLSRERPGSLGRGRIIRCSSSSSSSSRILAFLRAVESASEPSGDAANVLADGSSHLVFPGLFP